MSDDLLDDLELEEALAELRDDDDLDDLEVGDAVALPDRLERGFTGGRAHFSINTDGVESRVELGLDGQTVSFGEESADQIAGTETLDEALELALHAQGAVVVGDALTGGPYMVYAWYEVAGAQLGVTTMADASLDVCAMVLGGVAFLPANPAERTARWVSVPGLLDYYGLDDAQKAWVRSPIEGAWKRAAQSGDLPNVPVGIDNVSYPTLRLLLASHPKVVRVRSIKKGGKDRGGVVYGVIRPYITRDMGEPEVYVPVISMEEGTVDSINAWDLNAGISVTPVQVNVIKGHLFNILKKVWDNDGELFEACFGALGWEMDDEGGKPALIVDDGDETLVYTRKRGSDNSKALAGYFQSGTVGKSSSSDIDGDFRRELAARFRNLVLWPHVQTWLMEEAGDFLRPGHRRMEKGEVATLDLTEFDHDTFVLRALLMSMYVRMSASLIYTLPFISDGSASSQLAGLPAAMDAMAAKRGGKWPGRVERLKTRLYVRHGGQKKHAEQIHAMRS